MKYILKNEHEQDYYYSIIIKHSIREGMAMAQNFWYHSERHKRRKWNIQEMKKNFKLQIKHKMYNKLQTLVFHWFHTLFLFSFFFFKSFFLVVKAQWPKITALVKSENKCSNFWYFFYWSGEILTHADCKSNSLPNILWYHQVNYSPNENTKPQQLTSNEMMFVRLMMFP